MPQLKAGTQVRQKVPVITGVIEQRRFNADDQLEFRVTWRDADGVVHERWFLESEIEAVETAAEGSAQ